MEQQTPRRTYRYAAWLLPRLADFRIERGWTQRELAERAGVSISLVKRADGGSAVRPSTALKLAKALGVTVEQLRGLDGHGASA